MPTTRLPSDPSFENLRKQAKALRDRVRSGDAEAVARVKEFHPRGESATADFALSDAQLVVARSYGFASWPRLKEHLGVIERFSWAPRGELADPVDEFIRLACLDYESDHVSRQERARKMFAEHPEYARANLAAAATVGDFAIVRDMLRREPALAKPPCGPNRWEPLLYACYSRLNSTHANHSTLEVARLLLEHGADPNAGFLWRGLHSPFTALTGAFGEGEHGPKHQPPHQHCLPLARLLLDAGADPNDSQTLYNRHFNSNNDYLELLFEYGLGRDKGGPWFKRMGEYLRNPAALIAEEVWNAAKRNDLARVKLLAEHGVAIDNPGMRDGRTPYERALLSGNRAIAEYLRGRGVRVVELSPREQFTSACVAGDRSALDALLKVDASLVSTLNEHEQADLLHRAIEVRSHAGLRLMADLGFNLDARVRETAMHQAAWGGGLETVKLLIERGASPHVRDRSFNATPLGWAAHNNQAKVVEYLLPRADVFDAVAFDQVERLASLLDENPQLVHARDPLGQTPLHCLRQNAHHGEAIVRLLLSRGADANATNAKGETPASSLEAIGRHDLADTLRRLAAARRG